MLRSLLSIHPGPACVVGISFTDRKSIEFPPSLQLEERLLGGEPHVVHALGVGDAQARALPARQQQDRHLPLRDGRERQALVLRLLLKQQIKLG